MLKIPRKKRSKNKKNFDKNFKRRKVKRWEDCENISARDFEHVKKEN